MNANLVLTEDEGMTILMALSTCSNEIGKALVTQTDKDSIAALQQQLDKYRDLSNRFNNLVWS